MENMLPKSIYTLSAPWWCELPIISSEGHKMGRRGWQVKFYPNGNNSSSPNHLSCFLEALTPPDSPPDWHVPVTFQLAFYRVVRQQSSGQHGQGGGGDNGAGGVGQKRALKV